MRIVPVSAVVPTLHRPHVFARALASLLAQGILPAELIVVDASDDMATRAEVEAFAVQVRGACDVRWMSADIRGAAAQRNQGVAAASQPYLWFFDDDIVFEPKCVARLWRAIDSDGSLGGVSAMITNQRYQSPGWISRLLFTFLDGRRQTSFAGRVIGPAINLLPEDRDDLPEVVAVEWVNTTCTFYRRESLPSPAFDSVFTGYSLMEDLTLSLRVARKWKLANARTARIFHDSQLAAYKSDVIEMARMELINRHYVMTQILRRDQFMDLLRLWVWEGFQLAACGVRAHSRKDLPQVVRGKWQGLRDLRRGWTIESIK